MSVATVPWNVGAFRVGGGTVFGETELSPLVMDGVDGLIDAGASATATADLVRIGREADEAAVRLTFSAMETALTFGGVDPDKVLAFWRIAANYGAAEAVSLTARRCLQLRVLIRPGEGEA